MGNKKGKRVWTPEERKAFGEKMKAARQKKGVGEFQPKPEAPKPEAKPEEIKELSGIQEPRNVDVFIKNPVKINSISYGGWCNVPESLAHDLKYRSSLVDGRKARQDNSTDHGFVQIGVLR